MKTISMGVACTLLLFASVQGETVEMTTGPDLSVSYDPAVWKPLSPLRAAEPGTFQSLTWAIQRNDWAQISVTSHPERKSEDDLKQESLDIQKFRGNPAELVSERKQSLNGRDWLKLEFRNKSTRPSRSEISYFLPTEEGYVRIFVIGEEAKLPKHKDAVEAFLRQIHVK